MALSGAAALSAQLPSLPAFSAPLHGKEYSVHADGALASGDLGRDWAAGARAAIELDRYRIEGAIARVGARRHQHDAATAFGLGVARVLKHGLSPTWDLDLESGIGYGRSTLPNGDRHAQLNVPLGLGVSIRGPLPIAGTPALWLAPRVQLRRSTLTVSGASSNSTQLGGGLGLGLDFVFFGGFEAQIANEWLWIKSATSGKTRGEWGLRLSAGYRWQRP
jgi:hypothetical protein